MSSKLRKFCGSRADHRIQAALAQLQGVLQSMPHKQRLAAVESLQPEMKRQLLNFMSKKACAVYGPDLAPKLYIATRASQPSSDMSGIRIIKNGKSCKYQAHFTSKAIRVYALKQNDMQAAAKQQLIFVAMREALTAAAATDAGFWNDAAKPYIVCQAVLSDHLVSEKTIGLRAFVHMRAPEWLGQACYIISPVMALAEALKTQARLLDARRSSWAAVRAEWVHLLRCRTSLSAKRKSMIDPEAFADAARARCLQLQLARAVRRVTMALQQQKRTKTPSQSGREELQLHCRTAQAKITAAAKLRVALKQQGMDCGTSPQLQNDLSMEDDQSGPARPRGS